jgi:hypothetical protein
MKILDIPRSGSYAGVVSSRNRFGQYVRNRSIPVQPRTTFQLAVRARLSANSAAWRTLTAAQQAGWASLALLMARTDSLGQTYTPTGAQAYASVNNNLDAAGDSTVSDAPALVTPSALTSVTLTATSGGSPALSAAFTPTPPAAGQRVFAYASPQRSAGRNFNADYRLITVSAAAAASPVNLLSDYTARFGALVAGTKLFVSLALYDGGFLSVPTLASAIVA